VTINNRGAAAAAIVEAAAAGGYLDDLMAGMAGCFRRWEPRDSAKKYVRALMSDLPRKNCWTIAEHVGHATPGRMQHLLQAAKWDTMAAMAAVRAFVCEHLDDGDAVAILDESGQEKKGTATVGVKRQYVGCAGRISNAINVVYCSFATRAGHALVGARPYLPREWATDPDRCPSLGARGSVRDQAGTGPADPGRPAHRRTATAVGDRRRSVRCRSGPARLA
jgi:SRSO17 transposase